MMIKAEFDEKNTFICTFFEFGLSYRPSLISSKYSFGPNAARKG